MFDLPSHLGIALMVMTSSPGGAFSGGPRPIPPLVLHAGTFTGESRPMGESILAESTVLDGTAGGNGTADGSLNQPVLLLW